MGSGCVYFSSRGNGVRGLHRPASEDPQWESENEMLLINSISIHEPGQSRISLEREFKILGLSIGPLRFLVRVGRPRSLVSRAAADLAPNI